MEERQCRCTLVSGKPPPARGKSYAPAVQFLARANSILVVEAQTHAAARAQFETILSRPAAPPAIVKLSPRLFFTQVTASGKYWRFTRRAYPLPNDTHALRLDPLVKTEPPSANGASPDRHKAGKCAAAKD
ncbi:MAG TPA: hypothetical protein VN578_07445 [Candidatus Binatia bacterium]|jgi:hypothetical protein|nr:hypothetical protein [Candidatus Binatia bacterium]